MPHCIILNADRAVGNGIFGRFSNLNKCRLEAAGDVISGVVLDYVSMDVPASFGEYKLKVVELFDPLSARTRFAHFCAIFNYILQPTRSS